MSSASSDRKVHDSLVVEALPRIDSNQDYLRVLELAECSFDELCALGIVPIRPSISRRATATIDSSEFGRVPRSLLHASGLFDKTVDYVISCLIPWCSLCECEATRPKSLAEYSLPSEGVVAISIADNTDGFSLQERCELLGVERAIVDCKLVRSIEATEMRGEPVLCLASGQEVEAIHAEVMRWFSRGGGVLRILHFASRDSTGIELGQLQGEWLCPRCSRSCEAASRSKLLEVAPCQSCKGQGWLEVVDELASIRQRACIECHGVGSLSEFFSFRFFGRPLGLVMSMLFGELDQLLRTDARRPAAELSRFVSRVCNAGFANYPLGAAVELFSPGENALLATLVGELGMLTGVRWLLDGAYSPYADSPCSGEVRDKRILLTPLTSGVPQKRESQGNTSGEFAHVRDLKRGPLYISEFSFPLHALTAVQGSTGSGKSLLLETIAARFAKRRRLGHVCSFGALQRCTLLSGLVDSSGTVLELLGLERDVAAEIARTRKAKELGLLEKELELPRSKFRCLECGGLGQASDGGLCGGCQGALYDWRVASLDVLGQRVEELLRAPIKQLAGVLWTQTATDAVIKLVATSGGESVSLATAVRDLNPATRRFLKLLGGLGRFGGAFAVGSETPSLSKDLILIDGPYAMPDEHQSAIAALLADLQQRGATLVYASMPESLEMIAQSVLRLEFGVRDFELQSEEVFLDTRYAQVRAGGF